MSEECLICGAPLAYLEKDELMECAICHKKENSKTTCTQGHYVCNQCHMKGADSIIHLCQSTSSKNPFEIMEMLMQQPFCHMHGPEHHIMVGSAHIKMPAGRLILPLLLWKCTIGARASRAEPVGFGAPAGQASAPGCFSPSSQNRRRFPKKLSASPI